MSPFTPYLTPTGTNKMADTDGYVCALRFFCGADASPFNCLTAAQKLKMLDMLLLLLQLLDMLLS